MQTVSYTIKVSDGNSLKKILETAKELKQVIAAFVPDLKNLSSIKVFKNLIDFKQLQSVPATIDALEMKIKKLKFLLNNTDIRDQKSISTFQNLIVLHENLLSLMKNQVNANLSFLKRPASLETLKDIDNELLYQQQLRRCCSRENLRQVDDEIQRLNDLKTAFERNAHVDVGIDKITTYRQLESELQYYSDMLKTATASERTEIQKQINALNALRDKWDETLQELKKPDDISRLDTIDSLDKAISYYEGKQKKASAAEISDIARTISALEKKRDSLKQLARLPEMEQETDRLGGLGKAELKVELKAIGMDGLRKRIKELQNMLSDTKNPMSASQRKEMTKLVATYEDYEKILRKSDVTVEKSWSSIKGIGGGISSLTETLQENRGAWATITGVVDSAIQIYQGIRTVIGIVKALTGVTQANTTATIAQIAAKTEEASIDTTATGVEVSNSAARAAASNIETTADVAGAAAKTMKAHASIPWVGIAIGAGMVAMLVGIMECLPKFADGGIAYGPTLGIFGEYAGAKSNPEVVAPLDKLKSLIGDSGSVAGMRMETRVRGRDLVMAIANETRINRKRTNIKL